MCVGIYTFCAYFIAIVLTILFCPHLVYPAGTRSSSVKKNSNTKDNRVGSLDIGRAAIDVVITWNNSSDPAWISSLLHHNYTYNPERYSMNNEVQYNLLSLSNNALWIRNIFIVSQQSFDISFLPDSFVYPYKNDTKTSRVIFINHSSIIPNKYLPTFNSNVIEIYLHRIPGLTEIYMYLNDDMMLLKPLDSSRLNFPRGESQSLPVIVPASKQDWFCNVTYLRSKPRFPFHFVYINTINVFRSISRYNTTCFPWTQAGHFPYIQNKSVNELTLKAFFKHVNRLSSNKVRKYKSLTHKGDFNFLFLSNYVGVALGSMKFSKEFHVLRQNSVHENDYNLLYSNWKYKTPSNDFIVMQYLYAFDASKLLNLCKLIISKYSDLRDKAVHPLCIRYI